LKEDSGEEESSSSLVITKDGRGGVELVAVGLDVAVDVAVAVDFFVEVVE